MSDAHRMFATWKLDWINALMIGAEAREFRVAVCLLQFANSKTRLIFPSQARIAALLGCSERAVRRGIAQLVTDGWLEALRPNRHFANSYRFVEAKRDAMRDVRTLREDAFRTDRWGAPDPSDVMAQDDPDRTEVSSPDEVREDRSVLSGEDRSVRSDRTEVSSKHYEVTLGEEHYESAGADEEGDTLGDQATADQPLGAAAPTTLSKPSGGSQPPRPGSAIINSPAYQRELAARVKVDPFASLDRLEAQQRRRRAGGGQ